jgi:hypothetical protein
MIYLLTAIRQPHGGSSTHTHTHTHTHNTKYTERHKIKQYAEQHKNLTPS